MVDIRCPYCWTQYNPNFNTANYQLAYNHPPNSFKINDNSVFNFLIHDCPRGIEEKSLICQNVNCKKTFHTQLFKYNINNPHIKNTCYYYLGRLNGHNQGAYRKPILESILIFTYNVIFNCLSRFNISSKMLSRVLSSLSLSILIFIMFYTIPYNLIGHNSISILTYILMIITLTLMLYSFINLFDNINNYFNINILPLNLHLNYRNSNDYRLFEEVLFSKTIYGYPKNINRLRFGCYISLPTAFSLILIFVLVYIDLFYHFGVIGNIWITPFRLIFYFIGINMLFYTLINASQMDILSRIPLKINTILYNDFKLFMKIVFSSMYPMVILFSLAMITISPISGMENFLYFAMIVYILFISLIIVRPVWNVHKQIQNEKKIKSENILNEVNIIENNNQRTQLDIQRAIYLMSLYSRICEIKEWPFETNLLENIFTFIFIIIIPIISTIAALPSISSMFGL